MNPVAAAGGAQIFYTMKTILMALAIIAFWQTDAGAQTEKNRSRTNTGTEMQQDTTRRYNNRNDTRNRDRRAPDTMRTSPFPTDSLGKPQRDMNDLNRNDGLKNNPGGTTQPVPPTTPPTRP